MIITKGEGMGSVFRLENNNGFSCGYNPKLGRESFSEEIFLKSLKEVKKRPNLVNGIGAPCCVPRKDFFECFGLTFHVNHGHGHERQLEGRLQRKYFAACSPVSVQAGIFHFGSGGNQDRMPLSGFLETVDGITSLRDGAEGKDISEGLYLCFGCGKRRWPKIISNRAITEEDREVWKRGYWLCSECKEKNEAPKPHWMPWNQFL